MIDAIGRFCFMTRPNQVLTALNNGNSNLVLVVRDLFDSTGRIKSEWDRSHHGGRESAIEEVTTTAVWGFGIPLGKRLVDSLAARFSKDLSLPNLDLRLFNKDNPQCLESDIIKKYSYPDHGGMSEIAKTNLTSMANHAGDTAGKALLNKNRLFQFLKVSGVGLAAALFLGFVVPKLNQALTGLFVKKEKEQKRQAQLIAWQRYWNQFMPGWWPYKGLSGGVGAPLRMASPAGTVNPALRVNSAQPTQSMSAPAGLSTQPGQKSGVRFGMGNWAGTVLQKLQESDQLGTLLFSDVPLSSGRVFSSRNWDEKIEKAFKEAGVILTLFVIQQRLENALAGKAKDIGYPALKKLYDNYGSTKNKNPEDFNSAYQKAKKQLGIEDTKLGAYFESAEKQPELAKVQIGRIREYFNKNPFTGKEQPYNLLFDMAEASGKIPTIGVGPGKQLKHIDITKQIDMDGVKAMAHYLDKLAEHEGAKLTSQLTATARQKFIAFIGSAMVCWGIMSYLIPKVQHYITFKRTGKDYFPGVQDDAPASPAKPPLPSAVAAH